MPKIDKPSTVMFAYSPDEIVKLIIQDLAEHHGISASPDDVKATWLGGYMYDENASYSGGGGPSWKCDPVDFRGYTGHGKAI